MLSFGMQRTMHSERIYLVADIIICIELRHPHPKTKATCLALTLCNYCV